MGLAWHDACRTRYVRVDGRRALGGCVACERRRAPAAARRGRSLDDPPVRRDETWPWASSRSRRQRARVAPAAPGRRASDAGADYGRGTGACGRRRGRDRQLGRAGAAGVPELPGSSSRRRVPRRGAAARRRRAGLAGGGARRREGLRHLPRHCGQRLRAPEDVRAHTRERWLERARRFAVHALEQADRLASTRGRRRYSLWTGDVGAALYAGDCLDAKARYPVLDGM